MASMSAIWFRGAPLEMTNGESVFPGFIRVLPSHLARIKQKRIGIGVFRVNSRQDQEHQARQELVRWTPSVPPSGARDPGAPESRFAGR